ncbi:glycosyltransferase family 4 protein [Myxococcota bacterium]|nr:glycosyltransferase family 4 protein [Myxococcota bacterium]
MPAPPRVVHVDTATQWRGGQVQLRLLVAGMVARGWPGVVACPEGSPLWQALGEIPGVELLPVPAGRSPRATWRLSQSGADLLAAHTSHAHDLCLPLATPLVVHRRVDFVPSGGFKYRRPQAYACVSGAVARIVQAAGGRGCVVVHDGVAALAPMAPAPDGPTVLAVGARVAHKGHAVLAQAAGLLPGVDIGVAGDGPLTFPGLRWLGPRADVAALHAAAQVFVHPSVEEGMGQAVVEAMLAGLPVVCSDAGGLPEVVGDTGIVVPRGDARALALGIRRVLAGDHPPAQAARERAQRLFSVDAMVEGSLALYRQVAAAAPGG